MTSQDDVLLGTGCMRRLDVDLTAKFDIVAEVGLARAESCRICLAEFTPADGHSCPYGTWDD
jgi:hypothetical protein